ncbi:flavodoxin, partial [Xanthomonas citri pv. citri]|nr:flavodoxin [Xanthomonas citri pv. citri]
MTTLIVTSSAHGSTREIAERVAEVLRTSQAVPTVVEDVEGAAAWLATADAVIVAAPVYTGSL